MLPPTEAPPSAPTTAAGGNGNAVDGGNGGGNGGGCNGANLIDSCAAPTLMAAVLCSDEGGACWEALDEMVAAVEQLHAALIGPIRLRVVELAATELLPTEARAYLLCATPPPVSDAYASVATAQGSVGSAMEAPATAEAGDEVALEALAADAVATTTTEPLAVRDTASRDNSCVSSSSSGGGGVSGGGDISSSSSISSGRYGIELARVWCEHEYRARQHLVRCGFPSVGDTSRRHVHSVGASLFSPAACMLALAAAAADASADPREALPSVTRATWLPESQKEAQRGQDGT